MKFNNPLEDKKKVIDKLKSSSSLSEGLISDINEINDASKKFYGNLQSIQEGNNDPVDFLVDIIITMLGSEKLEETINKIFKKLLKKDSQNNSKDPKDGNKLSFEESIKEMLYKSLKVKNDTTLIPTDFITTGYRVPVKAIDLFDLYKTNPSSTMGKLIYGSDTNNFNYMLQSNVLMNPLATTQAQRAGISGVTFQSDNTGLFLDIKTDSFITENTTINNFFYDIIYDNRFELFDTKKIMADLIDAIYNFLSNSKTKGSLQMEEIIKSMVNNISNEKEIDTVFDFNPDTLMGIEANINKRKNGGYLLDIGCDPTNIELDINLINDMLDFENFSTNILRPISESGNETENQALKENIHRGLVKSLLFVVLKNTLFSPRLWTLFIVSSIVKTGYSDSIYYRMLTESIPQQQFVFSLLKDKNKLIQFIGNEILKLLCDYLLEIVIKEVTKLVTEMMTEVCKEKVAQVKDLLISLMSVNLSLK
jgi:hypothetical protein